MSTFNQWLETVYNQKADYTTNAPSYYDDLARKQKLFELLAKKIWEYDEELAKRFAEWDKNLEEFDEEVIRLLNEWINDGTFAHIINEEVFQLLNDEIDMHHRNQVSVEFFKNLVVDGDWSPAFDAAIASLPATGGKIIVPIKVTIKKPIILNKRITLSGLSYSSRQLVENEAVSTIIKDGNFDAITMLSDNCMVENLLIKGAPYNAKGGVVIASARSIARNVTVMEMGGDGFRVGNDLGANCNIWRLDNCFSLYNEGNGVVIHDGIPTNRDVNAGLITGLDTRSNKGDGLVLDNTSDNTIIGLVAQNNGTELTGTGVRMTGKTFGNTLVKPYVEANKAGNTKEIIIEVGAYKNSVQGHPAKAAYLMVQDLGNSNMVQTYDVSQVGAPPYHQGLTVFEQLSISGGTGTGNWRWSKDNGDLLLQLFQTSSSRTMKIKHPVEGSKLTLDAQALKIDGGDPVSKWFMVYRTVHQPDLPAHSQNEQSITIAGLAVGDTVILTPNHGDPAVGLVWHGYVSAVDTLTIRYSNITPNVILTRNKAWKFEIIKH